MIGQPKLFETYEAAGVKCSEVIGWNCPAAQKWTTPDGQAGWIVTAVNPKTHEVAALSEDGMLETY